MIFRPFGRTPLIPARNPAASAEENCVDALLRNAEQILETAVAAQGPEAQDCAICISSSGAVRMVADPASWSLAALAYETGAAAVYRVERRGGQVRVEGWSQTGECVLRRQLPGPWWSGGYPFLVQATLQLTAC